MSAYMNGSDIEMGVSGRYARGWHCLGLAKDYSSRPVSLRYFDKKLVVFRGADGAAVVLDAYCPHMGADLALGEVDGNSIRCPFHHWRWRADGVCDHISYAKRIPPRAVIKSWSTMEENHLLFVWNDPEGNAPIEEQRIPRIHACFGGEWSEWSIELYEVNAHYAEVLDSMADVAHFLPVHGARLHAFANTSEGHIYVQEQAGGSESMAGPADFQYSALATYYGPAYMVSVLIAQAAGRKPVESRLLVSHIPLSVERFHLRFGVMVRRDPELTEEENQAMVAASVKLASDGFKQDIRIWQNKIRMDRPLLCQGDGPIQMLRKWHRQFHVDVTDVPATLRERRVYRHTDKTVPKIEHRP